MVHKFVFSFALFFSTLSAFAADSFNDSEHLIYWYNIPEKITDLETEKDISEVHASVINLLGKRIANTYSNKERQEIYEAVNQRFLRLKEILEATKKKTNHGFLLYKLNQAWRVFWHQHPVEK